MSKPKIQTRLNMTTIDLAIDMSVSCYRAKPELMMPLAAVEVKISSTDRPGASISANSQCPLLPIPCLLGL